MNRDPKLDPPGFTLNAEPRTLDDYRYELRDMSAAIVAEGDGIRLYLRLTIVGQEEQAVTIALRVPDSLDPYIIAADLLGTSDVYFRQKSIEWGFDVREREQAVRMKRRQARLARRQLVTAVEAAGAAGCDFCPRPVAFTVEGRRYCKRHAEEHGVRPHGKIGESDEG